ncbi:Tat pathway signal sequence domain protein [Neisseria sp. oral taxon 020 str. F0370]|uniref:GDSL-type esterase/lipase family protein n=1 Tax=unclassified Neisseria TaxID=2623750 RepID=UPI0002A3890A|nr:MULTISPECIES: GDSL-type esterase/lipase family protein [unclassified Neisseria]ASP16945.1 arylesterase [Neisseria sp. KEM232]EKY04573.1 Tat pathway signal sequence domain protein [Neisseria sp. oral taxon 020 str. F0370]
MPLTRRRFLALAAALAAAACTKTARHAAISRGSTVVALGDSLTYGYGAPPEAAYPVRLAAITGWTVVNGGVSGDTSAQALARLPALLKRAPKLVLLGIGGNDFLHRLPESDTRRHIGDTIAAVQGAGVPIVLIAEPKPGLGALVGSLSDHPLYAGLAEKYRVPLFADGWSRILSDGALKSDAIHANAEGYALFAERLAAFLQKQGFWRG